MYQSTLVAFFVCTALVADCSNLHHQQQASLLDEAKITLNDDGNHGDIKSVTEDSNPCGFVLWKQCDSQWADIPLGTSTQNTICSAGCAMSSTSMIVATWNNNTYWNPETLNSYLLNNNGYVDSDLIVWSAVDSLNVEFEYETTVDMNDLIQGTKLCYGYIANVLNGEHWVLLTAYAGNNNFYVNDPGFDTTTYAYDGMGDIVVYHPSSNITRFSRLKTKH